MTVVSYEFCILEMLNSGKNLNKKQHVWMKLLRGKNDHGRNMIYINGKEAQKLMIHA